MKICKSEYIDSMKVKVCMASLNVLQLLCIKKTKQNKINKNQLTIRWSGGNSSYVCLTSSHLLFVLFCLLIHSFLLWAARWESVVDLVSTLCPAGSGFVDLTHAHSCVCPAFPLLFFYPFLKNKNKTKKHLPWGKVSRTTCLPAQRLTAVKAESLKALQCDGPGGVLVVGFYGCVPINFILQSTPEIHGDYAPRAPRTVKNHTFWMLWKKKCL